MCHFRESPSELIIGVVKLRREEEEASVMMRTLPVVRHGRHVVDDALALQQHNILDQRFPFKRQPWPSRC